MRASQAVIKAISNYLKSAIPSLLAVSDDWPNPSQPLKFPSITVLMGDPKFTQMENYVVYKGTVKDPKTKKYPIRKCNGSYDLVLKAHLWADSKPKRHELYDLFMAAMNPDFRVSGLRLQIADYFNEWATFDVQNHAWLDNEENTQRAERRIIVDILVNVRSIVETSDYLIEQIENSIETPDSIANTTVPSGTKII